MKMIQQVFAVHDSARGAYARFFCEDTIGTAMREFMHAAEDPNSLVGKYSEDFTLFLMGSFDLHTGELKGHEPVPLANAKTGRKRDPDDPEFQEDNTCEVSELPAPLLAHMRKENEG